MPERKLRYLFTAYFADGTSLKQTQADTSVTKPPDANGNGGSSFTDVAARLNEVVVFDLVRQWGTGPRTLRVDLRDGHFEWNGIPMSIHDPAVRLLEPLRLVYFRQAEATQVSSYRNSDLETPISVETSQRIVAYRIGWESRGILDNHTPPVPIRAVLSVEG